MVFTFIHKSLRAESILSSVSFFKDAATLCDMRLLNFHHWSVDRFRHSIVSTSSSKGQNQIPTIQVCKVLCSVYLSWPIILSTFTLLSAIQ